MTEQTPSISIIVFAYNEAGNVASVLSELCDWLDRYKPDAEVVFVDDGSTDQTSRVAEQALDGVNGQLLRHKTNRGIGAALKTGVRAARAPWVTFMPADGQIEPEAIGALYQEAEISDADVVFSVYDHRDDGLDRKILSWGVRMLIRIIHGVSLNSDGPYLFKRSLFVPDQLPSDTFFLNFEFPITVLATGVRVSSVTIHCRPRISGTTKSARMGKVFLVAKELFGLRIRRFRSLLSR